MFLNEQRTSDLFSPQLLKNPSKFRRSNKASLIIKLIACAVTPATLQEKKTASLTLSGQAAPSLYQTLVLKGPSRLLSPPPPTSETEKVRGVLLLKQCGR